jgi:HlyD family secretion protein
LSLQEGSVITGSQKIASIKTDAVPTVSINLTEIDAPRIKIGNQTTITMDAFPGKSFTGKVVSIDTVGSITSGVTVYPTVIKFDSANLDVLSNMSAQASIITKTI